MSFSFGWTGQLPLRRSVVSSQAAFLMRGRLLDLAGSVGNGARRPPSMKLIRRAYNAPAAGIKDAHASADFSHSHAYVCFKRLFESYSKIPVVCETVEFSGVKRVKHGRYTFKLGQEARADARNAHNVNDLFANAIKSGRDEQFRPVVSRLIRV